MSTDTLPEPDRIDGAPHPSQTARLFGQQRAERDFLEAYNLGRLHHGWLVTGPRGIGKATLAWRMARFLLATPEDAGEGLFGEAMPAPDTLDVPADHPVARRMQAGSEAGLFVLRRGYDEKTRRLRSVITVDEVRKLKSFFSLSAAEGGRRVVIVDAADEMNVSAANALLKLLEEPPEKSFLILISHQPSRLLPTIRSRCRELRLSLLSEDDLLSALKQAGLDDIPQSLVALSGGSVGEALRLANLDGVPMYQAVLKVLETMPRFDRQKAQALAEMSVGRGAEEKRALLFALIDQILARIAKAGVVPPPPESEVFPGEGAIFARLCPDAAKSRAWAEAAQEISDRNAHGLAVNLDPAALILDTVFRIQKTAGG
ncbi:MAG: DNA polymerase III subunit delta' [Paracoccaceae bacterium]|jgi:DNA polymerase-3 subunit delta'|nr:DNA polymerase III subunit delta' [Paracoccaceae bacterium]MDP7185432.1 DNA polymerase III subunit delta' [Paracoccaceae bacterium]